MLRLYILLIYRKYACSKTRALFQFSVCVPQRLKHDPIAIPMISGRSIEKRNILAAKKKINMFWQPWLVPFPISSAS